MERRIGRRPPGSRYASGRVPARPAALVTVWGSTCCAACRGCAFASTGLCRRSSSWRENADGRRAGPPNGCSALQVLPMSATQPGGIDPSSPHGEGADRDYLGERYEAPATFHAVQASLPCGAAARVASCRWERWLHSVAGSIRFAGPTRYRRTSAFFPRTPRGWLYQCSTILDEDDYRFEIVVPFPRELVCPILFLSLRSDCLVKTSQLGCNDNIENTPGRLNVPAPVAYPSPCSHGLVAGAPPQQSCHPFLHQSRGLRDATGAKDARARAAARSSARRRLRSHDGAPSHGHSRSLGANPSRSRGAAKWSM